MLYCLLLFLRFKTATKGRQQEQHLGRRGAVIWAAVLGAGRTLATAGRSNSLFRPLADKCHHFIVVTDNNKTKNKKKTTKTRRVAADCVSVRFFYLLLYPTGCNIRTRHQPLGIVPQRILLYVHCVCRALALIQSIKRTDERKRRRRGGTVNNNNGQRMKP